MNARTDSVGVCSCGRLLYPCFDEKGKRIGVTHTPEDDEFHCEYWAGARILLRDADEKEKL